MATFDARVSSPTYGQFINSSGQAVSTPSQNVPVYGGSTGGSQVIGTPTTSYVSNVGFVNTQTGIPIQSTTPTQTDQTERLKIFSSTGQFLRYSDSVLPSGKGNFGSPTFANPETEKRLQDQMASERRIDRSVIEKSLSQERITANVPLYGFEYSPKTIFPIYDKLRTNQPLSESESQYLAQYQEGVQRGVIAKDKARFDTQQRLNSPNQYVPESNLVKLAQEKKVIYDARSPDTRTSFYQRPEGKPKEFGYEPSKIGLYEKIKGKKIIESPLGGAYYIDGEKIPLDFYLQAGAELPTAVIRNTLPQAEILFTPITIPANLGLQFGRGVVDIGTFIGTDIGANITKSVADLDATYGKYSDVRGYKGARLLAVGGLLGVSTAQTGIGLGVKAIEGIGSLIFNPVETISGEAKEFGKNPLRYGGRLAGTGVIFKPVAMGLGKIKTGLIGTKTLPKIKWNLQNTKVEITELSGGEQIYNITRGGSVSVKQLRIGTGLLNKGKIVQPSAITKIVSGVKEEFGKQPSSYVKPVIQDVEFNLKITQKGKIGVSEGYLNPPIESLSKFAVAKGSGVNRVVTFSDAEALRVLRDLADKDVFESVGTIRVGKVTTSINEYISGQATTTRVKLYKELVPDKQIITIKDGSVSQISTLKAGDDLVSANFKTFSGSSSIENVVGKWGRPLSGKVTSVFGSEGGTFRQQYIKSDIIDKIFTKNTIDLQAVVTKAGVKVTKIGRMPTNPELLKGNLDLVNAESFNFRTDMVKVKNMSLNKFFGFDKVKAKQFKALAIAEYNPAKATLSLPLPKKISLNKMFGFDKAKFKEFKASAVAEYNPYESMLAKAKQTSRLLGEKASYRSKLIGYEIPKPTGIKAVSSYVSEKVTYLPSPVKKSGNVIVALKNQYALDKYLPTISKGREVKVPTDYKPANVSYLPAPIKKSGNVLLALKDQYGFDKALSDFKGTTITKPLVNPVVAKVGTEAITSAISKANLGVKLGSPKLVNDVYGLAVVIKPKTRTLPNVGEDVAELEDVYVGNKSIYREGTKVFSDVVTKPVVVTKVSENVLTKTLPKFGEVFKPITPVSIVKPVTETVVKPETRVVTKPIAITRTITRPKPIIDVFPKSPVPFRFIEKIKLKNISKPLNALMGKKSLLGSFSKSAFDVYVRKGGKSVQVGKGLPFGRATRLGVNVTEYTTARSFSVKPSGFTRMSDVALPKLTQYRKPKRFGKVERQGFSFVEKSKYAINTPTEKAQLKAGRLSVFGGKSLKAKISLNTR